MFGDPIKNPVRWHTDKIINVAPILQYTGIYEEEIWLLNLDMVESKSGNIIEYIYTDKNSIGNSTCKFNEENVLYSKLRPYLNKVVIPKKKGYATSEMIPFKPKEILDRVFFVNLLRSDFFVSFINDKVAGSKMPRVNMQDLKNFDVILPPIHLQNQFADFVQQVDKSKFYQVFNCLYRLYVLKYNKEM